MEESTNQIYCKWEKIFENCDFVTNHFLDNSVTSSNHNSTFYRLFVISREITFDVIDSFLKNSLENCSGMDFQKQSHTFWYGNILHACVETLTLSSRPEYSSCLLYLLSLLIENSCRENVDMLAINAYEQTPKEVLITNMIDAHNDINIHKKHTNTHYIMSLMFSNINRYKSKISFVFNSFKMNLLQNKHKKSHNFNLTTILYSPPCQVGQCTFENFPGGSAYHSTIDSLANIQHAISIQ